MAGVIAAGLPLRERKLGAIYAVGLTVRTPGKSIDGDIPQPGPASNDHSDRRRKNTDIGELFRNISRRFRIGSLRNPRRKLP